MFLPLILAACTIAPDALGQPDLLDRGFRQMYNLQFAEAHVTFGEWERTHPSDPMGPVADAAAFLFAEFDRLRILQAEFFTDDAGFLNGQRPAPDSSVKKRFEDALGRSERMSATALARNSNDATALFADVLRLGLHADYLGLVEKNYWESLRLMKAGRIRAEQLLAAHPTCYDAYVAVGAENYMLSLKPMPVRWLLRMGGAHTDKDEGLRQLAHAAGKGQYLLPFARLLQAVAALRDGDRTRARELLGWLSREFPLNPLYSEELKRLR